MTAGEKIRVLVVDDVAETRENIRKLLQFEKDVEVVGAEGTGRAGVTAARELKPDVVLMDINMPDMDGISATEMIRRHDPACQIVILSVQGDPNYMRRAMLAGARDFLTKPPSVDELTTTIRRAGQMAAEERKKASVLPHAIGANKASLAQAAASIGKVIVVYGPKGGTGATTIAVNLAIALHSQDKPVVVVDGNLQFGDVAVFLNEQVKNSVLDLAARADELDKEFVEEVLIEHSASGLKILAAPPRPEYAENVSGEQFTKVIDFLRRMFAYIIVDGSSNLTDVILAAMEKSDIIVLITAQDIPSIKNARLYLDLADVLDIHRQRILFVMNRHDKRIGITPEKVSESFKHEIVAVLPSDERVVMPSINRGVPFMLGDRSSLIAKSIHGLADQVRQRISELVLAEAEEDVAVSIRR
jgi:pilus assembly protein CpaE